MTRYDLQMTMGRTTLALISKSVQVGEYDERLRTFYLVGSGLAEIALPVEKEIILGRTNQPHLAGDSKVSRQHAMAKIGIFDELAICDLNSTNGTRVTFNLDEKASTIGFLY